MTREQTEVRQQLPASLGSGHSDKGRVLEYPYQDELSPKDHKIFAMLVGQQASFIFDKQLSLLELKLQESSAPRRARFLQFLFFQWTTLRTKDTFLPQLHCIILRARSFGTIPEWEYSEFVFFWEVFRFRNERDIIPFILLPIAE